MGGVSLDFLDPLARDLVVKALAAVVDHPDIHQNRFLVGPKAGDEFEYVVGQHLRCAPTPFPQSTRLPINIFSQLQFHGIAEMERAPDSRASWLRFTDAALAWYRAHGGPTDHEIQARIGRVLFDRYGRSGGEPDRAELIRELGLPEERVGRNLDILVDLRYVRPSGAAWSPGGPPPPLTRYSLSKPSGLQWANGGFRPIGVEVAPVVNVELRIEIQNVITEARSADVPPALLEQFEARVRRVEEELAKPEGRFESVKEMMETANQSKELLGPAARFLYRNWDKIQTLADVAGDAAGRML